MPTLPPPLPTTPPPRRNHFILAFLAGIVAELITVVVIIIAVKARTSLPLVTLAAITAPAATFVVSAFVTHISAPPSWFQHGLMVALGATAFHILTTLAAPQHVYLLPHLAIDLVKLLTAVMGAYFARGRSDTLS